MCCLESCRVASRCVASSPSVSAAYLALLSQLLICEFMRIFTFEPSRLLPCFQRSKIDLLRNLLTDFLQGLGLSWNCKLLPCSRSKVYQVCFFTVKTLARFEGQMLRCSDCKGATKNYLCTSTILFEMFVHSPAIIRDILIHCSRHCSGLFF